MEPQPRRDRSEDPGGEMKGGHDGLLPAPGTNRVALRRRAGEEGPGFRTSLVTKPCQVC